LENKFTDLDLIKLYDEAPKTLHLNSLKAHFVAHERWVSEDVRKAMRRGYEHNYSSPYLEFLESAYSYIFLKPLEHMPLYINVEDEDLRYLVKWRLKVGK